MALYTCPVTRDLQHIRITNRNQYDNNGMQRVHQWSCLRKTSSTNVDMVATTPIDAPLFIKDGTDNKDGNKH